MNGWLIVVIIYFALDVLCTVAQVGKRIHITPGVAVTTVVTHAALIVILLTKVPS